MRTYLISYDLAQPHLTSTSSPRPAHGSLARAISAPALDEDLVVRARRRRTKSIRNRISRIADLDDGLAHPAASKDDAMLTNIGCWFRQRQAESRDWRRYQHHRLPDPHQVPATRLASAVRGSLLKFNLHREHVHPRFSERSASCNCTQILSWQHRTRRGLPPASAGSPANLPPCLLPAPWPGRSPSPIRISGVAGLEQASWNECPLRHRAPRLLLAIRDRG